MRYEEKMRGIIEGHNSTSKAKQSQGMIEKERKSEDDRITRPREGDEKSKRDTVGGHREYIARGPGNRGDNWQHFDTTKAKSTLLLNKNQFAAKGVAE